MPEIIKTKPVISKDLGPQCDNCDHYKDEHNGPNAHCMRVLYTVVEPDVTYPPRKLCPCKEFMEIDNS